MRVSRILRKCGIIRRVKKKWKFKFKKTKYRTRPSYRVVKNIITLCSVSTLRGTHGGSTCGAARTTLIVTPHVWQNHHPWQNLPTPGVLSKHTLYTGCKISRPGWLVNTKHHTSVVSGKCPHAHIHTQHTRTHSRVHTSIVLNSDLIHTLCADSLIAISYYLFNDVRKKSRIGRYFRASVWRVGTRWWRSFSRLSGLRTGNKKKSRMPISNEWRCERSIGHPSPPRLSQ